ncbi:MAG: homoserine kinase [Planctomycetes bacterium]|nr:homoserine kinase [Planctomycetota bacterium]
MNPQSSEWSGLRLRVPASTSNLGPGFDFLGLALALFLEVRVESREEVGGPQLLECTGLAQDWPRGEENLLLRSLAHGARALGISVPALRLCVTSQIPMARGLGSSGASVAAGLLLAERAAGKPAGESRLLALGLELEGHPDNSSAALLGGCTLAVPRGDGTLRVVRAQLSSELGFALAWSEQTLPTRESRAVLPAQVAFGDAVENPRRLALLLEGLRTADAELLALGIEDRLHVRYRLPLIRGGAQALEAARATGACAATISGSGSALVAIAPRERAQAVADALGAELRRANGAATACVVEAVHGAPRFDYSRA